MSIVRVKEKDFSCTFENGKLKYGSYVVQNPEIILEYLMMGRKMLFDAFDSEYHNDVKVRYLFYAFTAFYKIIANMLKINKDVDIEDIINCRNTFSHEHNKKISQNSFEDNFRSESVITDYYSDPPKTKFLGWFLYANDKRIKVDKSYINMLIKKAHDEINNRFDKKIKKAKQRHGIE